MIHSKHYQTQTDCQGRIKTEFTIKYRFWQQVAPKDRHDIRARITNLLYDTDRYLGRRENLTKGIETAHGASYKRGSCRLVVSTPFLGIPLRTIIKVSSNEIIPEADLFDSKAFDEFILTGEIPGGQK